MTARTEKIRGAESGLFVDIPPVYDYNKTMKILEGS